MVTPTYRKAWDSVIPSYRQEIGKLGVLDKRYGKWSGGQNEPVTHVFDIYDPVVRGVLHLEVLFRAIQDEKLEEFVRGDEVTAWWMPETDTQPEDLIPLALNRAGRYPSPDHRPAGREGAAYAGVFGDANVPDLDTWFFRRFWLTGGRPEHWHLFRQPAGLLPDGRQNPDAENLENLRKINPRYYEVMASDMEKWAVRRFLQCRPGYSRHGEPVHEDFDDEIHVAKETIPPNPHREVIIGVDGGGNTMMPGATFGQTEYSGAWNVLADFSPTAQTNVDELGDEILRTLNVRVRRAKGACIVIDPAAGIQNPQVRFTYAQQLQAKTGIEVRLAPTNDPQRRRAALKRHHTRTVNGRPGILYDPSCTGLITAYAGGFRYRKVDKLKGALRPEKNQHSHVAEAGEYMVLGGDGLDGFFDGIVTSDGHLSADAYPQVEM